MKRRFLSIITAFAVIISMVGFMPTTANAQMCSFTLYVNGAVYSSTASYATSGKLTYNSSTRTVYLNGFSGQSIAAIPGGSIGDDDSPVINVNVSGYNSLSGGIVDTGEYSCIYAEPRQGGDGDDSSINISGTGTLKLGKNEYDFTKSATADYSGIKAGDEVNISGGVTVNAGYTIEGLNDTGKYITGIEAEDVTVTGSILTVILDGKEYYPSQYSSSGTKTTAAIYGIKGDLKQSGIGYTNIDTTATNASSSVINCVNGDITIASSNAAVYLSDKKGFDIQPDGCNVTNNYSNYVGTYKMEDQGNKEYAAYVTYTANSKLNAIDESSIYKLMRFDEIGYDHDWDGSYSQVGTSFYKLYSVTRISEDGQSYSHNSDCTFKGSNDGDYIYEGYISVLPAPGYMLSKTIGSSIKADIKNFTGFTPDITSVNPRYGIISVIYMYPDLKIAEQPADAFCADSTYSLNTGISAITKSSLATPANYNPEVKYEWYLKATENGSTVSVPVEEMNIGTGYDTASLTINKTNCKTAKVTIDGEDVALSDADELKLYCVAKAISGNVKTKEVSFNPLGHFEGESDITPAGFGTDGSETIYCDNCGEAYETNVIAAIDKDSVKVSKSSYTYTGKAIKPAVYAKDINGNSIASTYKAVTYKNYTSVGKATATVKFKGNYSGTKSVTYKIVPKTASIKSTTAGTKKVTVKMSTKVSSTGGSTYQIAYKQKGTSTWKYTTTTSSSKTISSLKKGKYYYVKVRAYKSVSGTKYYGAWSSTKLTKKIK